MLKVNIVIKGQFYKGVIGKRTNGHFPEYSFEKFHNKNLRVTIL